MANFGGQGASSGGGTPRALVPVKYGGKPTHQHQFTGSVFVSGSVYAHEYNVDSITKTITNIDQSGSTKFGDDSTDTHQFSGSVFVADDAKLYLGGNQDSYIFYDEQTSNRMVISGSNAGLALSGSKIFIGSNTIPSGSRAGPNSYVAISATDQLVIVEGGGSGGSITALNNATENELVTIGSTTTELDAEANLTFDGSTLRLKGFMSSPIGVFNSSSIDDTVTLPANYRCLLYGPITIGSQGEFTIGTDSSVKIKSWDDV